MSESRPALRHTPGEWGIHREYCKEFKLSSMIRDDGSVYSYCTIVIASGELRIAEVQFSSDGGSGWPQVKNFNEFKANVALMSAAPNLLEVCERFAQAQSWAGDDERWAELWAANRAAIAKATTY